VASERPFNVLCEARLLNQIRKECLYLYLDRRNLATFFRTVSGQKFTESKLSKSQRKDISPIWRFGGLSDESTGMTATFEYTFGLVDICIFCSPLFLQAWLSQMQILELSLR
jgi:hypothetical protein